MKTLISTLGLFFVVLMGHANDFELLREYREVKNMIAVDPLGNIFSLEKGILKRFDNQLSVISYSNPALGPITHIDVSNPMSLVVFFEDFGVVVTLDRNLTEKRIFLSSDFGSNEIPRLICSSFKGGFWAFFESGSSLVRYNEHGLKETESIEITKVHPRFTPPDFMVEHGERVYLAASGIWAFDLFGNYLFNIPQISPRRFQVLHNKIYYLNDAHTVLNIFDIGIGTHSSVYLPLKNIRSFFLLNDILFLQTDVSLKKFRFEVPF